MTILWGASENAQAHIGDNIYLVYEIDNYDLLDIDFRDVSIADWEDIVGYPSLTANNFYSDPLVGEGAQYDPSDLDYRIWLGWNRYHNRLYMAMERVDDRYINEYTGGDLGQLWRHDAIEFMVDGDHTGGDYTGYADENWTEEERKLNNNRTAQQYLATADTPDGRHVGYLGAGAGWVNAPPYADGGGGSIGAGPTTSIFEFYVTPFDDLIWNSPDDSKPSNLNDGDIIGFQIAIPDFDIEPSNYRAFHTLTGQAATWRYADRFADGRLVGSMGQNTVVGSRDRVFELPLMNQAPILDGVLDEGEWEGALELDCSPSRVQADGAEYGWRDIEAQQSEVSVNQLVQSYGEDAFIARTDADFNSRIWQAWDDDGLWVATAVADNVRDVEGSDRGWAWWERDSLSLYVDLVNEKEEVGRSGEYTALNIINFQARPLESSPYSVSWARTVNGVRSDEDANDPDLVDGFLSGYRYAGDEFGGEADYVLEMFIPWENLLRFNLPEKPAVGTEMGFSWLTPDPDGDDAYGGQLQCWGWADDPYNYSTWVFSDTPAGLDKPFQVDTSVGSDISLQSVNTHPDPDSWYNRSSVSFSWDVPDTDFDYFLYLIYDGSVDGVDLSRDGTVTTSNFVDEAVEKDGQYAIEVGYQAGNTVEIISQGSFKVDTSVEGPTLQIFNLPDGQVNIPPSDAGDSAKTVHVGAVDTLDVAFDYLSSDLSGYDFLSYRLDVSPSGGPSTDDALSISNSRITEARLVGFVNGANYLHVLTKDVAGNEIITHYRIDVDKIPPDPVTNLFVRSVSNGDVVLAWDSIPDADSYRIYRSTSKEKLGFLIDEVFGSEGYRDFARENGGTVVPELEYFYTVRAVDSSGNESVDDLNVRLGSKSSFPLPFTDSVAFETLGRATVDNDFVLSFGGLFPTDGAEITLDEIEITDDQILISVSTRWNDESASTTWSLESEITGLPEGLYEVQLIANGENQIALYDLEITGAPGLVSNSVTVTSLPSPITVSDPVVLHITGDLPSGDASVTQAYLVEQDEEFITVNLTTQWGEDSGDIEVTPFEVDVDVGYLSQGYHTVRLQVNGEDFFTSILDVLDGPLPEGPITLDFNTNSGDQGQRVGKGAVVGKEYALELNANEVSTVVSGWNVEMSFDPTQLEYVAGSFQVGPFISGLLGLEDLSKIDEGIVSVGGTVLGTDASGQGTGVLGSISFVVAEGFSGQSEIQIDLVGLRPVEGDQVKFSVSHTVSISDEVDLVGDGNGDGVVGFDDFFLFADAFGGSDPAFDYDGSGQVDFSDFFIFADNFGKEAQAKLIAMAHEMIGLPKESGLLPSYPNPFNMETVIPVQIMLEGNYMVTVYNASGQLVRNLHSGFIPYGLHRYLWDGLDDVGRSVSTGLYLISLQGQGVNNVQKVTLLK